MQSQHSLVSTAQSVSSQRAADISTSRPSLLAKTKYISQFLLNKIDLIDQLDNSLVYFMNYLVDISTRYRDVTEV